MDNAGGDDKNNGLHARDLGDTASPVRTIAKALQLARAGDRIVLANSGQPYRECVSLVGTRHSGAAPLIPFILDGNGVRIGWLPRPIPERTLGPISATTFSASAPRSCSGRSCS